jgi:hypothetical protein
MRLTLAVIPLLLAGCAAIAPVPVPETQGIDAVLIGEQHDAAAHPRLQERWVRTLARARHAGAVALEMAERGTSTAGLPRTRRSAGARGAAMEQTAPAGLGRYGPAIMAAVRAGVPVLGAQPAARRAAQAMKDETLDALLPGAALKAQQQAIRRGHCEMLPETRCSR